MKWSIVSSMEDVEKIREDGTETVHLIYKHSSRCSLSSVVLDRLERNWNSNETNGIQLHFLDLIQFGYISQKIAELFGVRHESPQVIMVKGGNTIYHESHFMIDYMDIVRVSTEGVN